MTAYEIIATALSTLAVVMSVYTLHAQRRLHRESIDLQRATSDLAKKQLEMLLREDQELSRARVSLELVKESRNSYRFVITNVSDVDARHVNMKLLLDDPATSPLIKSEVTSKLPAPRLPPGNSITLIAALHMQSPLSYRAELTWINPDKSVTVDETYVSL